MFLRYSVLLRCNKILQVNYARNITNYLSKKTINVIQARNINFSHFKCRKIFVDTENAYAYNIIENYNQFISSDTIKVEKTFQNADEFNAYMKQNWRKKSATEIVEAFKNVQNHCVLNEILLSDHIFDNLTDGLMDNVENLTDNELFELLDALALHPKLESYKDHNFHDIWSALDDTCCWRLKSWDISTLFLVGDKWYRLNLGRVSDFLAQCVLRVQDKLKYLSTNQIVHTFFYINILRKNLIGFDLEVAVEQHISAMTVDQMAIVALGYFKTETKIKLTYILMEMMRAAQQPNIHDITLTAILKIVKFSSNPVICDALTNFLNEITARLPKHSILCNLHAAVVGTSLQIEHRASLKVAAQKIVEHLDDVQEVRLKDMERILVPLTMFNCETSTTQPDIYRAIFEELHADRRLAERVRHPRCLPCALHYLSMRELYSYELMNMIFDDQFIVETYGKSTVNIPRELFCLEIGCDIECPDYKGARLPARKRIKGAKWHGTYPPSSDTYRKPTAYDKLYMDVLEHLSHLSNGNLREVHALPSFQRNDIILCRDRQHDGQFVAPSAIDRYEIGDVMRPPIEQQQLFDWFAFIIVGWNSTIRDKQQPVGLMHYKMRLLEKIGYRAIPVIWNEYITLSKENKLNYLLNKLNKK